MKKIITLLFFVSAVVSAQTQKTYKHSLAGIKKIQVESGTSLIFVAKNINEITLVDNAFQHKGCDDCDGHADTHTKPFKEKTKGLTAIYPGGKDNADGLGFSIKKENSTLIIKDLKSNIQRHGIRLELPKDINISVDSGNLGNIEIIGFTSEIEANTTGGSITMKDVTGPITVHSSIGAINIDFSKVNQSSPITVTSSGGEIDVALPATTNADLELKTHGTIYTNFDIEIPTKKGMKNVSGTKKIISKINNGGVKIKLKSSLSNIYLRKK